MKKILFSVTALFLALTAHTQVVDIGPGAQVIDLSNNGIAVGNVDGLQHFMWSDSEGGRIIGQASDLGAAGNQTISANGTSISASVINPETGYEQVGIYTPASDEWYYLDGLGTVNMGSEASSWGMSSNGEHIVGISWVDAISAHATIWNGMDPAVDLGATAPNRNSRANDVNADGSIVVGWVESEVGTRVGALWNNGVLELLVDENGENVGEALSVSADGQTITGYTLDGDGFVYSSTDGFNIYSHENSDYKTFISAISDDGETAVGFSFNPVEGLLLGEGIIWKKESGIQKMDEYVESLGFESQGLTFSVVTAISPDGKYVGGIGVNWDEQMAKGFVISVDNALSVPSLEKNKNISIYPNPFKDILHISAAGYISSVNIFNILGQKVVKVGLKTTGSIDLSHLKKGVYFVKVTTDLGNQTFKVIKE